jgi:hypothetical protein
MGTNIVKEELQIKNPLVLDDHIAKNHIGGHDIEGDMP